MQYVQACVFMRRTPFNVQCLDFECRPSVSSIFIVFKAVCIFFFLLTRNYEQRAKVSFCNFFVTESSWSTGHRQAFSVPYSRKCTECVFRPGPKGRPQRSRPDKIRVPTGSVYHRLEDQTAVDYTATYGSAKTVYSVSDKSSSHILIDKTAGLFIYF